MTNELFQGLASRNDFWYKVSGQVFNLGVDDDVDLDFFVFPVVFPSL